MEHGLKIWPVSSDLLTLDSITCTPLAARASIAVREAVQSQLLIPATSVYLFQVTDNFTVSLNIDNEYQKTKFSLCPFHFVNKPPKVMSKRKNIILFFLFLLAFLLKQSAFSTLDKLIWMPSQIFLWWTRIIGSKPIEHLFQEGDSGRTDSLGKVKQTCKWEGNLQLKTQEQTPTLSKRTKKIFFRCLWRGYRTWLFSKI